VQKTLQELLKDVLRRGRALILRRSFGEARKAKVILGTMRPRSKATLLFVESIVCLPDKGRRGYCGPYQLDSSRAPAPWGEQLPGGRREAPYVSLLNQNVRPLPVLYPQVSSPESRTVEVCGAKIPLLWPRRDQPF